MPEMLHIITPVGRPQNLPRLAESIADSGLNGHFTVHWWLVYNADHHEPHLTTSAAWAARVAHVTAFDHPAPGHDATGRPAFGHAQRSAALDRIADGWVWVLDDDNAVHPAFAAGLARLIREHPHARGFVVGQERADGQRLAVTVGNLRPFGVDTAQYILRRDLIGPERVRPIYADDGGFIQRVYGRDPASVVLTDTVLCYHNWLTRE